MNIFSCSFYWLVFITGGLKNRASEGTAEEMAGERSTMVGSPPLPFCHLACQGWGVGGQEGVIQVLFNQSRSCLGPHGTQTACSSPWGQHSPSVLTTALIEAAMKMANSNGLWSAMEKEASISAQRQECGRISVQVD